MKKKDNTMGSDAPDDSKGEQPSVDALEALGDGADMDLEMTRITSELQEAVEAVRQSFVSASHAKEETITQAQAEADTVRAEANGMRAEAEAVLADALTEANKLIADSKTEAETRLSDAHTEANKLIADSKTEAGARLSDAHTEADKLTADSTSAAETRLKEAEKQAADDSVQAADQAKAKARGDRFSRAMDRDS